MLARNLKPPVNPLTAIRQVFYAVIVLIALITIVMFAAIIGLNRSIDNQNVMLCESAQVSGNWKYQEVCAEYYKTGKIDYMRDLK